jgi:hypothetical protein
MQETFQHHLNILQRSVITSHTPTHPTESQQPQDPSLARRHPTLSPPHPLTHTLRRLSNQMCIIVFSMASCLCPPVPAYPYLRLCPAAKSHNPIRACPQGSRCSETIRYTGDCSWCIQCGREAARQERRGWVRGRLESQGRESLRSEELRKDVARMDRERGMQRGVARAGPSWASEAA